MSNIDDLIAQMCPEGVRFDPLESLLTPSTNIRWTECGDKEYRYVDLGSVDRTTHSIVSAEVITSTNAPSRAQQIIHEGDVIFGTTRPMLRRYCLISPEFDGQIASTGYCVLRPKKDQLLSSFLFHVIGTADFYSFIEANERGASYPAIPDTVVKKYRIPVPPLEVQREIVRILDQFTQLEAELEVELEAELEARRRQYDHYLRLQMLFPADIPRVNLGELVEVRSGWGFPKAEQGVTDGGLPFYKVSDMNLRGNETVMRHANNYVSESVARKLGLKPAPPGTVIFPKIGAAVATNKKRILSAPAAYDNNVMGLIPGPRISSGFLYHWMQTFDLTRLANDSGAVPSIRKSEAEQVLVPLVPLSDQYRIAQALDSLSALVNALSVGLPSELSARRKQYEYYHDRLLTFKEAAA